jgi:glycosyltransferase involved in cell wall biosynthesis
MEGEWNQQATREFEVLTSMGITAHPNLRWSQKLRWMLDSRMPLPHGCGASDEVSEELARISNEFDLIWFCKLRTANMFSRWAWARSVADIDDVPSTFDYSVWKNGRGMLTRLSALRRFVAWRRRDSLLGERFSVLGVCSSDDKRYLHRLGVEVPIHVIPNGFEVPASIPVRRPATPPRLGFIGIFDYQPNLEAACWFVERCWPMVKESVPEARLRLVGRYSDGALKPEGVDIDGLGWVEKADEEINTWSAMIVPVQSGAGTRGKIAQAFSLKCPVVSTSIGAYGYEPENGKNVFLADSPEDFASACIRAIRQPADADAMAERAWGQFVSRWSWDAIRPSIWAAAEDCLRRSGRDKGVRSASSVSSTRQ